MAVRITLACAESDRTLPLILGDVRPQGIDLVFLRLPPEETFWRMLRHHEFDAAEMSLSSYVIRRSRGEDDLVAIPVFPSRQFRHSGIFVRADAGIAAPADLKGKRMGVPEYQVTAAVWMRGFLQDDYGVAPTDLRWFQGGLLQPGRAEKQPIRVPGLDLRPIGPDQTLSELLLAGELDAIMAPRAPAHVDGVRIRRLFPDYRAVEADYFRRTGIFPIMHTLVVRRDVLDSQPWVARSLYDAFCHAKAIAMARLGEMVALAVSLPWQIAEWEATRTLMGEDYWPYGLEANRVTLEALVRYSVDQGLAERWLEIEALFAPSTLDEFRV